MPMRRDTPQKHHRLPLDPGPDQDGEKAVLGDEGFEQGGGFRVWEGVRGGGITR